MKKIFFILVFMFCAGNLWAADTKISDFTADATPTTDDLMPTVNDPGGTPANRKTTIANLQASVFQPLDGDLTYLATVTPTANVKAIWTAEDYAAIWNLLTSVSIDLSAATIDFGLVVTDLPTEAATIVNQDVDVADTGADSALGTMAITPTASRDNVRIYGTCADDDGCTGTLVTTSAVKGDKITFTADGSYLTTFAYNAASFVFLGGGPGKSLSFTTNQIFEAVFNGTVWVVTSNQGSVAYINVTVPSFSHISGGDYNYSDTTTPHQLIAPETYGTVITNYAATEDRVYTLPANPCGAGFVMGVGAAFQMDLEPASGEALWLNGTQMTADEHIINASDTEGQDMSCVAWEAADGVCELHCKSSFAGWAQETP